MTNKKVCQLKTHIFVWLSMAIRQDQLIQALQVTPWPTSTISLVASTRDVAGSTQKQVK